MFVVTVNAAVMGLTSIFARTTTGRPSSRSNGPAFAGFTIDSPNGAPSIGPVRYDLAAGDLNGSSPSPTLTIVSPISLSGAARAGVRFGFAAQLDPGEQARQARRVVQRDRLNGSAGRLRGESVVVRSLNEPALLFVVPDAKHGANGIGLAAAGLRAGCRLQDGTDFDLEFRRRGSSLARPTAASIVVGW